MLPRGRHKKYIDLLSEKEFVTIQEFSEEFGISVETVRRDLSLLQNEEKIEKVYGGAKLKVSSLEEPPMRSRWMDRIVEKEAIGKKSAELIEDGDFVFIDSGTTTYQIAKNLREKKNLTVITNSIPVINELLKTEVEIIVIGGRVRREESSITAHDYMFDFSKLNIQKCFICASGITLENGISDFDMQEVSTRKKILSRSSKIFVTADSSKFEKDMLVNVSSIESINSIITDSGIKKDTLDRFRENGVEIIVSD